MEHRMVFWDRAFIDADNVVAKITTTTKEVIERLAVIEKKIEQGRSLQDIIEDCYQIVCRVPIFLSEIDVPFVVRCRPDDLGGRLVNVGEMSYNPNVNTAKPGRFNIEREPVFYAVIPSENHEGFPIELAAIFETLKELRDEKHQLQADKIVTISYWKVVNPFWSVFFPFHDEANEKNQSLNRMSRYFEAAIKRKYHPESQPTLVYLNGYLSNKASAVKESDKDYMLTAAFKHGLERYYGRNINAIFYPGAMSDSHCINVAIDKRIVEPKYLKFGWARMYKITTDKKIIPITNRAYADENNNVMFSYL